MNFSNLLIHWYLQNKRDLPWRETTDPYPIWLSEIMLQQTRVAQGLPYFLTFLEAFPTVTDLASATEEKVLKLWQGLGYYSRARNLHATAQHIAFTQKGNFPTTFLELKTLKGVGDYTAAAIASFAFNEPVPVVDGNVYRVLARYFGIETDIASSKAKQEFFTLAHSLLPKNKAATFNQALMEFGALQCTPKNPNCMVCCFNESCSAFRQQKVTLLPIKLKKTKITLRYLNYLILKDKNENSLIQKRTQKDIWHNLYEFPLLETESETNLENLHQQINERYSSYKPLYIKVLHNHPILHKLSHQHLHIRFWEVATNITIPQALSQKTIKTYPFPIVIHNFIKQHWKK